jgi:hypothetical protein
MCPTTAAKAAAAERRAAADAHGQRDAGRAFGDVEHGHDDAGADTGRAQDVGGAEIAAADLTQIGLAPAPRQEQRERNRADEVSRDDGDNHDVADRSARASAMCVGPSEDNRLSYSVT